MFRPQLRQLSLRCERVKFGLSTPARQFSYTPSVAEEQPQPSGRYTYLQGVASKTISIRSTQQLVFLCANNGHQQTVTPTPTHVLRRVPTADLTTPMALALPRIIPAPHE